MTLEEAQAQIVDLQNQVQTLETEKQNFTNQVNTLNGELEKVREINQKYFLMLTNNEVKPEEAEEEKDEQSLEEFARELDMI